MNWWTYVTHTTGGASQTDIAKKVGISGSSITRWRDSAPKPENVASFARAYSRPVLEAFVAAGFLSPEDANQTPAAAADPTALSDSQLLEEIKRRLDYARTVSRATFQSDVDLASYRSTDHITLDDTPDY